MRPPATAAGRLALAAGLAVLVLATWWWNAAGPAPSVSVPSVSVPSVSAPSVSAPSVSATSAATSRSAGPRSPSGTASGLQAKARAVLQVVDATGQPPQGYVGGRQFQNDGRGGTAPLPRRDPGGTAITYHEYDVNPYRPGVNRGPERLVVGSDGSAWCTGDHYVTWIRLR